MAPDLERFARTPMADRLLGVLGYEALQISLRLLVFQVGRP